MRRAAPDAFRVPDVGLVQWWALGPEHGEHWYVSEAQRAYRVLVDDAGRPFRVLDDRGRVVSSRTPGPPQGVLV